MKKILLLVDGSNYLYRAFYALPSMRNTANEPTGAIYGVVNMLRRLLINYPTVYLACIFDAKGKNFRDDIYPAYKANRPPMPADLAKQIAPIKDILRAGGWPVLTVEGVESDDVIGTLSVQAISYDMQVAIATSDKDMAQLVNDDVVMINTTPNETLDLDAEI